MKRGLLCLLLVSRPMSTTGLAVCVWDGVLSSSSRAAVLSAGEQRKHSFTSILDRSAAPAGRTIIESALAALLDELDDDARFVEYWWRGETKGGMEVHRDVDEALCRTRRVNGIGLQRCPKKGHVLYLDIGADVRAPTCIWEEITASGPGSSVDPRAGAPRLLEALHVVPASAGRLLRFDGAALHSVADPAMSWLGPPSTGSGSAVAARRAVILFNTWQLEPPTLPSPSDPPAPAAVASYRALETVPEWCLPRGEWEQVWAVEAPLEAPPQEAAAPAPMLTITAPLLGDACRRNTLAAGFSAEASREAMEAALRSDVAVHRVGLDAYELTAAEEAEIAGTAAAAAAAEAAEAVEVDEGEELAMRLGHAEFLESEFWGSEEGDADDDDDEEEEVEVDDGEDEDEESGLSSDFFASLAELRRLSSNPE